jgi:CheY-like chemotaxis protein
MPIVDGLTSTKMIRSYEKTHINIYSPRAAFCGRLPIIAVSASLIEKERQQYIDAGFDAWILKPISFVRLGQLMAGVVDTKIREGCLYEPGQWERGGWFHMGEKGAEDVSTAPSGEPPVSNPSDAVREAANDSDNPMAGEENEEGRIPEEQERLLKAQEEEREKASVGNEGRGEEPEPSA